MNNLAYHLYRFKYRFGRHLPLKVPVDVTLELSSHCNMKCRYCYHSEEQVPFEKGFMSTTTAYRILDQAAEACVNSLKFNWKGEPTTNPNFSAIAHYAYLAARSSDNRATFQERIVNSNFKFDTAKTSIFFGLSDMTKVKVSLDSFSKAVFDAQRAGGDHGLTIRNIDKFYHCHRENTELVVQAVRTRLNHDEDLEYQIKRHWPQATVSIRDMVVGRKQKNEDQLQTRGRDFSERQSCLQAHVRMIFNWKGDAFPCCPDVKENLNFGNIHSKRLTEIFNSIELRRLRAGLKDKSAFAFDPCRQCSSFETFKGFKPIWNS